MFTAAQGLKSARTPTDRAPSKKTFSIFITPIRAPNLQGGAD
jgi:hypothetical protein